MSELNLNEKTVIELRKLAKEMKVPLSAGISKQGIIDRLTQAMDNQEAAPAPVPEPEPAAQEQAASAPDLSVVNPELAAMLGLLG